MPKEVGNKKVFQSLPSIICGDVEKNEQIYAKNTDFILLHSLNNNAEAISDESVYIYGGTYGKVFAGIKNPDAFIFISNFQAQLICIAGVYKKFEQVPEELFNKTLVINLESGKLNFKTL